MSVELEVYSPPLALNMPAASIHRLSSNGNNKIVTQGSLNSIFSRRIGRQPHFAKPNTNGGLKSTTTNMYGGGPSRKATLS
ncbi:hypothetical protein AXF42_Ash004660 [Apostasia shenzhenica]|uniref:Uncharacterized protein n=1 Tax=Apostasia shenzhenica TaxID=1088818 RepID=A0A2I0BH96_9ASPA|nr:hypothetical protein AXF42_Ash004660 [Apostasia shenzhenica]